jgi:quercetin dioxygenase-like cupin family protein
MTAVVPNFDGAVVVKAADAETMGWAPLSVRLLADSSDTGGAISVIRTTIGNGADGARPHTHSKSAELFYILDGQAQVLTGDQVVTAGQGDLVVVPPSMAHAFAAAPGHSADLLIVIAPGVERFGYFRLLERLNKGEATVDDLLASQEQYDNHFLDSPAWRAARG